jgi:hypothetical protein
LHGKNIQAGITEVGTGTIISLSSQPSTIDNKRGDHFSTMAASLKVIIIGAGTEILFEL